VTINDLARKRTLTAHLIPVSDLIPFIQNPNQLLLSISEIALGSRRSMSDLPILTKIERSKQKQRATQ
jgi:hypothetical protein